jgi:hypothetical protein
MQYTKFPFVLNDLANSFKDDFDFGGGYVVYGLLFHVILQKNWFSDSFCGIA